MLAQNEQLAAENSALAAQHNALGAMLHARIAAEVDAARGRGAAEGAAEVD